MESARTAPLVNFERLHATRRAVGSSGCRSPPQALASFVRTGTGPRGEFRHCGV